MRQIGEAGLHSWRFSLSNQQWSSFGMFKADPFCQSTASEQISILFKFSKYLQHRHSEKCFMGQFFGCPLGVPWRLTQGRDVLGHEQRSHLPSLLRPQPLPYLSWIPAGLLLHIRFHRTIPKLPYVGD